MFNIILLDIFQYRLLVKGTIIARYKFEFICFLLLCHKRVYLITVNPFFSEHTTHEHLQAHYV